MEIIIPDANLMAILPQILVSVGSFVVLLMGVFAPRLRPFIGITALVFCGLAMASLAMLWNANLTAFSGMITVNLYTNQFCFIILLSAILLCLVTKDAVDPHKTGEFFSVLLISTVGMLIMASSQNLLVIFLGLEIMSIGLYVLIGMNRSRVKALEASLKYFLLGAFASGFFLYGIALTYGTTGSFDLTRIARYLETHSLSGNPMALAAVSMILIGFGFKVALVPFHMWSPDVYQGSPAPVTAIVATGPKAAAFAAFARVFVETFDPLYVDWAAILYWICLITMVAGNLLALIQRDIKRMLAFSSIAHAGYIIMAILAGPKLLQSSTSIVFYVTVYTLMNLAAFTIIQIFESREGRNMLVEDFSGFGAKYPWLSVAMSVAMLSLAGFPLTGGFIGKFQIFSEAVEAGYVGLTIVAVITTLISVYYYLRVMVMMYFKESEEPLEDIVVSKATNLAVAFTAASLIVLGIVPGLVPTF